MGSRSRGRWDRLRDRDRMHRQGVEDAREEDTFERPLLGPRARRPPPSKADLRDEAEAALVEWKRRQENR
jgi:hypothetical protein